MKFRKSANSAPITRIEIGRRSYTLGILSHEAMADVSSWGQRIVDSQKPGGIPLNAADRDPFRILRTLLRAGDPKIEVFHKILKSGCKAEDSKLRTAERLVNLISIFCIDSWRIFWMTMLNRASPDAPPSLALTRTEMRLLDNLVPEKGEPAKKTSISRYLIKIARPGGYLAPTNDPPPGNIVLWRGCRASPTSKRAPSWGQKLWVIESPHTASRKTLAPRQDEDA